ncbi:ATP-binding protein [Streptomyces sp. NPDC059786]|uniref:ATP-binding protein n=1 Tax=Streptomyces sp. NPDC059786 TaxID=3346946 RepID=UPI0036539CEA
MPRTAPVTANTHATCFEVTAAAYARLAPEAASAARARTHVTTALCGWGLEQVVDDAALVASELVTNAVQHTASDKIKLGVVLSTERRARIEVWDQSRSRPVRRAAGPQEDGGRGLAVIARMSERWGTDMHPTGKCVWAVLRPPANIAPPPPPP